MAQGILDILSSLFTTGQIAQPQPGQPQGQQQVSPGPLGTGMGQNAANLQQLYPIYQQQAMQAQMNGQAFPPFEQWAQSQGYNVVLPR